MLNVAGELMLNVAGEGILQVSGAAWAFWGLIGRCALCLLDGWILTEGAKI